jgi:hypothetical protein
MIRILAAAALALVCASPTSAALQAATCATLPAAVATAPGGSTINLAKGSACENLVLKRTVPGQVTINAGRSIARGVTFGGSGIYWRSGAIVAPKGVTGKAGEVYGVLIRGYVGKPTSKIRIEGVAFGLSRKAIVIDTASDITITKNRFDGVGEDGVIASAVTRLTVTGNTFRNVVGKPTSCTTAGGVIPGLARRDCEAQGGAWTDGFHADAVQMRNGVTDALIADNDINADTQGITQMDTIGDAPLVRVRVERNSVTATIHHITLGANCVDCLIRGNTIRRYKPTSYKAVIRPGAARRCANDTVDEPRDVAC